MAKSSPLRSLLVRYTCTFNRLQNKIVKNKNNNLWVSGGLEDIYSTAQKEYASLKSEEWALCDIRQTSILSLNVMWKGVLSQARPVRCARLTLNNANEDKKIKGQTLFFFFTRTQRGGKQLVRRNKGGRHDKKTEVLAGRQAGTMLKGVCL